MQSWVTGLTTTHRLAASTSRTVFNTVNAVFRAAVRDRMVPHNPCAEAKLPSVPRKKIVPLAVEQVRTLSEEIPARYKGLVLLGAATGLRPGELFGLQLRHVDLLHATVSVEQQIQQTAKHGVYVCPPKTARSHRTVPLPRMAVDAMKAPRNGPGQPSTRRTRTSPPTPSRRSMKRRSRSPARRPKSARCGLCADRKGRPTRSAAGQTAFRRTY